MTTASGGGAATAAGALVEALRLQGVELWVEGDRLRFRAPRGALSDEQRASLAARRDELVAHLREEAAARETWHPLSHSQRSLWFVHQQAPRSAAYHIAVGARVLSRVDAAALRAALQALVDRHASLRTTYAVVDAEPRQRVAAYAEALLGLHGAADLSPDELRAAMAAEHARPFDLERGPLLRASLWTRAEDDHALLLSVHHIAADGWSLFMLLDELLKLYAAASGAPVPPLPRPAAEYVEHVRREQELLAGAEGERLWGLWRDRLAAPRGRIDLPGARPRPGFRRLVGASLPVRLDPETSARLTALARAEEATLFVVLLASFQAFLHRVSGAEDVLVGTPTFGRSKPELMGVVGHFVNSVPLRARVSRDLPFRELVRQLRPTVLEALAAQALPLPVLVQRLQPERDPARSPLFDTFFALQRFKRFGALEGLLAGDPTDPAIEVGPLRLAPLPIAQQEGQFDLALQLVERDGAFRGVLTYDTDLLDDAAAERLARTYTATVEALAREPDLRMGDLPMPDAPPAEAESTAALLERLRARDVRLLLDGEKLRVNAPKGALTDELKALVAARRDALVALLRAEGGLDAPARVPRDGPLPLSSTQERLWFLDRVEPGRSHYNIGTALRLRGALDLDALRGAVEALVRRHESLRTRLPERDGAPVVELDPAAAAGLEVVAVPAPDPDEAELRRVLAERLSAPFELARGPLASFLLLRVAADHHVLAVSMHHVVSDGWSTVIVVRELLEAYDAIVAGRAPALPELRLQAVDHAAWERARTRSPRTATDLAWWKDELAGAPGVLELPTDRPRPPSQSFRGRRVRRVVDGALLEDVKRLARRHEATPYMALLAAFQSLLHRYSGQEDVVVGSPAASRDRPELERVVGCFVNNLVLRGRFAGDPSFSELLARTRRATLGAFEHQQVPFDVLVEALRPERSTTHAPIFQILFALQSFPIDLSRPASIDVEPMLEPLDTGVARFDLALDLIEYGGELHAYWEYSTDLFDDDTVGRMHDQLVRLLRAAVADPSVRIRDLPLLGPDDERLLLREWNDTALAHDRARCVHQLLEESARATPGAPAVISGATTLTFRELDDRANRLAHLLLRRGVTPGSLVAVCVDRTDDMPAAIAAVLKAGAAYVPLDPTHPADRLRYTLEDAGVACAITLARFAPLLAAAGAPLVLLDEAGAELAAAPATSPGVPVRPEDRAYVIYTSGSTGRPKGVEVEHRNVVAFLEAMRREPGFRAGDALLAVTTLSFDIAGLELWLPLATGGRVVIASRAEVLDGGRLAAMLEEHGITVMQATPATWRLMLDAGWAGKRDLRVLCGGEPLPRDLALALAEKAGELWNMYGPTETTIWSTVSRVERGGGPITIGKPILNTRVYVLDPAGRPTPIGVPGELCIGGEGVARGYRNRPELTADKFVPITLPDGSPDRVYRTGDVARFRGDGRIDFLGRRDHQVKVRGFRIELGEIEAVLAGHPGVKECVVVVREDTPGDPRLAAYLVPAPGAAPFDPDAVRDTLRAKLPEYMVPGSLTRLEALPLTPNGKIDRKALPAPQAASAAPAVSAADALMSPHQRRVADAWREVLRIERVGLHDNFFDVGGHSLLLVKLHAALKREFDCDLALVELFQWTTVAAQAVRLSSAASSGAAVERARARAARQTHV